MNEITYSRQLQARDSVQALTIHVKAYINLKPRWPTSVKSSEAAVMICYVKPKVNINEIIPADFVLNLDIIL